MDSLEQVEGKLELVDEIGLDRLQIGIRKTPAIQIAFGPEMAEERIHGGMRGGDAVMCATQRMKTSFF
jgi:hypothetical protein